MGPQSSVYIYACVCMCEYVCSEMHGVGASGAQAGLVLAGEWLLLTC